MSRQIKQVGVSSHSKAELLRLQAMAAEYQERVGERIRDARRAKNWSQNDLARAIPGKTGGDQVGRWERGEVMPRTETLEALAVALGVDVSYFLVAAPEAGTPDLMGALKDKPSDLAAQVAQLTEKVSLLLDVLARREGFPTPEAMLADLEQAPPPRVP